MPQGRRNTKPIALFIHSAGSQRPPAGSSGLVARLRKALAHAYQVRAPRMPSPGSPEYGPWQARLETALEGMDDRSVLIGHSLGGSVLVKHLAELPRLPEFAGLFLVAAPYWGGQGWGGEDFRLPLGFGIRLAKGARTHLYHGRGDPIVPVEHLRLYARALPKAAVRTLPGADHVFARGIPALAKDILALRADDPGATPRTLRAAGGRRP